MGGYVARLLRFPSAGENGQDGDMVTVRYYEITSGGPKPLVVILPIWGTYTYPPAIVASDLLGAGRVNVARILGDRTVVDWKALASAQDVDGFQIEVRRMVERVRSTVIDVRRLLDWAETRPAIDPRRVALIGFSESTFQVAGVMASDARPAAAVLVMGGAHPHEIFATCYGPPQEVRAQIRSRFGWTRSQFADALAPLMRSIDPANLGSRLNPERVLIFDAEQDDCVPRNAREALWEIMG